MTERRKNNSAWQHQPEKKRDFDFDEDKHFLWHDVLKDKLFITWRM